MVSLLDTSSLLYAVGILQFVFGSVILASRDATAFQSVAYPQSSIGSVFRNVRCRPNQITRIGNSNDSIDADFVDNDREVIYLDPPALSEEQQRQEKLMERSSIQGSQKISSLSVSERAKRAMLAEAIEDSIFCNIDKMDRLFDSQGMLPETNREEAYEIAKETKQFQQQYQELVSGESSSVLNALEQAWMPPSSNPPPQSK